MFDERHEESKNEDLKEVLEIYRVDAEVLSSKESSLLEGAKDFSELREGESVDFSLAEVKILCNLHSVSLEASAIRCPRREEVLR